MTREKVIAMEWIVSEHSRMVGLELLREVHPFLDIDLPICKLFTETEIAGARFSIFGDMAFFLYLFWLTKELFHVGKHFFL
jgi:hypothetical protein